MRVSAILLLLAGCAPGRRAILTDGAPKPRAPYSQAVVSGGFVFVSGQGPTDPATGRVELEDVRKATRLTIRNIEAILEGAGTSLDRVVKVNVYLRDIADYGAMNEVYAEFFGPPAPARTTIQAGALPGGIPVEIACVAAK